MGAAIYIYIWGEGLIEHLPLRVFKSHSQPKTSLRSCMIFAWETPKNHSTRGWLECSLQFHSKSDLQASYGDFERFDSCDPSVKLGSTVVQFGESIFQHEASITWCDLLRRKSMLPNDRIIPGIAHHGSKSLAFKQACSASRDVMLACQICGSKLQRRCLIGRWMLAAHI